MKIPACGSLFPKTMEGQCHHNSRILLAFALLAGCSHREPVPFDKFYPLPLTSIRGAYQMAPHGINAFTTYQMVAKKLMLTGGKSLGRVSFHPAQKRAAIEVVEPYIGKIESAMPFPCVFDYQPRTPFSTDFEQMSWDLLGKVLVWKAQDAIIQKDWDAAIRGVTNASKFGFDLMHGNAADASLGFSIADGARKSIAPHLGELSPKQLSRLSQGIKKSLDLNESLENAIANEWLDALCGLQWLQDNYRDGQFRVLSAVFGPEGEDAINYLKNLPTDDPKRADYFESFRAYIQVSMEYADKIADLPVAKRAALTPPELPKNRPWRRLAKYFVKSPLVLVRLRDSTLARTRLLIIEAELTRLRKLKVPMPKTLDGFSANWAMDPFSGRKFGFQSDQIDTYRVYSVGSDLVDNNGQTDADFTSPDLVLEKPAGTD